MIDLNDYDLRISAHADRASRIDETGWWWQSPPRTLLAALAGALTSLAVRLAHDQPTNGRRIRRHSEQPSGA